MNLSVLICILTSLSAPQPHKVAGWLRYYHNIYKSVPIKIVVAVGYHESKLKHIKTYNKTNDIGIMQINKLWEDYCKIMFNKGDKCKSIKTLKDNIRMGFHVLDLGREKGSMLRYYNYGNPKYPYKVRKIIKKIEDYKSICQEIVSLKLLGIKNL